MNLMRTNRLPWLLSGALGASLVAGSCLGGTSSRVARPPNRLRPRASRVTGVRQGRRPMRRMDRSPPPDSAAQDPNQSADQGPSQYPGQASQDQAPTQYPNQAPPPPAPAGAPGVGYGQPPRPAYQPGQNQSNGYQAPPQGVAQTSATLRPRHLEQAVCCWRSARVNPWIRRK